MTEKEETPPIEGEHEARKGQRVNPDGKTNPSV